jgi:hypothetical protein
VGILLIILLSGIKLKTPTGIADEDIQPLEFSLFQNYPNPFNPATTITYEIPMELAGAAVQLKVYNLLGKEVASLIDKPQPTGIHNVSFDGSRFASGVYFYKLQTGDLCITKKMLLVK